MTIFTELIITLLFVFHWIIIGLLLGILYVLKFDFDLLKDRFEEEINKNDPNINCQWCKHHGDCSDDSECWDCSVMCTNNFEKADQE